MQIHGRTQALIGVLATAICLAIPASAFAGHDLGIYKAEKHLDLNSDETQVDVNCYGNDYALDGMWRIDHGDQDDDDISVTAIGRAVDVREAYPVDSADSDAKFDGYHFFFDKNVIGRAQVKVWALCIKSQTEQSGGHSHSIPFVPAAGYPKKFTAAAGPPPGYSAWPGTTGTFSDANACPSNTFVSTPGYKVTPSGTDPVPYAEHLGEDWPTSVSGWSWIMDLSQDSNAKVDFYLSCVSRKLPAAGGERHKLVYRLQGPEDNTLAPNRVSTKRISCAAHYKAVVAGFSLFPGWANQADPSPDFASFFTPNWWYLGMDPQPKSRDFKFLNATGVAATNKAHLKAICLNYRTT